MAVIPKALGEGGAFFVAGDGGGKPSLPDILRDIADDLATLNGGGGASSIAAPALGAFSDPPTAPQMAALRTLVNEIRAAFVASGGGSGVLKTTKG